MNRRYITTESQLTYLFQQNRLLHQEIARLTVREEDLLNLISILQDGLDRTADAIRDSLHGIDNGAETYEQAFNRVMERLRRAGVG